MFKTILITLGLIILSHIGYSQNDTTIYYKANNKPALGKEDALRYIVIKKKSDNQYKILNFNKTKDSWKRSKYTILATIENDSTVKILNKFTRKHTYRNYKPIGEYYYIKEFYENGNLRIEGLSKSIISMHWEGQVKTYYDSGHLESISRCKNNQVHSNKNWLETGEVYLDDIFNTVDIMPEFPGGLMRLQKYLAENIKYPKEAEKKRFQGKVFISFVIDTDGKIIGAHVQKALHPLFDKEALRAVSEMPQWRTGELDGKPVKVGYTVPINFRLQ